MERQRLLGQPACADTKRSFWGCKFQGHLRSIILQAAVFKTAAFSLYNGGSGEVPGKT
jgi:hypothetical protein